MPQLILHIIRHRFVTAVSSAKAGAGFCILSFIGFQFLLFPHFAAAAPDRYILYPADKSAVTTARIQAVGSVVDQDSPPTRLVVKNKKERTESQVKVLDKGWSAVAELVFGMNTIKLVNFDGQELSQRTLYLLSSPEEQIPQGYFPYYLHSTIELAENCADCHIDGDPAKPNFRHIEQKTSCLSSRCHVPMQKKKKYVHGPMAEGSCVECHNPHGTRNENYLKFIRASLCFDCHGELESYFDKSVVHFPVARGECLLCHDPHQSDLEFHLKRGTIKELCRGCHGDRVTSHKIMHEPVEAGDCSSCHDPHVSDNKALLVEKGDKMCFVCHKVREEEFERKYIHKPVKESCINCHDPHGSSTVNHLKTELDEKGFYKEEDQPIKAACLLCHRKLNPEITHQIEFAKVPHKPVVVGSCLICHTAHSTNHKKQLRAPLSDICFACHKEMKIHIESSKEKHGPVHKRDCEQCHRSHGGNFQALLVARFENKFSGKFNTDKYRLCFNCHNVKVYLEANSIETGFRNGEMNLHYFHVNKKKSGCKTCHDIHASNQEKHVRTDSVFRNRYKIKMKFEKTATGGTCMVGCHPVRQYDRIEPVKNLGKQKK